MEYGIETNETLELIYGEHDSDIESIIQRSVNGSKANLSKLINPEKKNQTFKNFILDKSLQSIFTQLEELFQML